ncbi:MAG: DUF4340 domain-containing protein [Thermoanaerobaculia bacterium]
MNTVSKTNRKLTILAVVLMALSLWAYRESVNRTDRFQRGQVFLSNLNPDEIARVEIRQADESVTLERQGETFRVVEEQGYPASNAAVNRLVGDLLELSLEKEVGTGTELAAELELEPVGPSTVEVLFQDAAQKEMVRMRLGLPFEGGPGRYVQRLDRPDDPIYLTSGEVHVTVDSSAFLRQQIIDVPVSEVARIVGADFTLTRQAEGGELRLIEAAASEETKGKQVGELESILRNLSFENVFVADDEAVRDLDLLPTLSVDLEDGSGYDLAVAEREGRYFLQIAGRHAVSQVAISLDEAEEELQEKADMLTRADEIDDFNQFHGSWIYEIGEADGRKLLLRKADLVEAETT